MRMLRYDAAGGRETTLSVGVALCTIIRQLMHAFFEELRFYKLI